MLSFLRGNDIFNQQKNKNAIKNTIAVLMISVVNADDKITLEEQKKVLQFYKQEFNMNEQDTISLFESVKYDEMSIDATVQELQSFLNTDILAKAKVLQHLNSVIICDGCVDSEYTVFENIKLYLM